MKILLINLPTEGKTKDFTTRDYLLTDFARYPPLGLLAIAAEINPRHSVKVLDVIANNMSIDKIVSYILKYKPDVLGISVVTRYLYAMHEIARRIKESDPSIKIVVGGAHVNCFPLETMQLGYVDYALPGYGEKIFPQLIEVLDSKDIQSSICNIPNLYYKLNDGQIHSNPATEKPLILDDLPFPNRRLINLNDYFTAADKVKMTSLYSSRGCPFRCIFCDVQEKKFHFRSAKRVVDEFEEILNLGIREIFIFDDTFNLIRQRVADMCNEIIRRRLKVRWAARVCVFPFDRELASLMKKSGCTRLHAGIESLDPRILKFMKKGITLEHIKSFFKICNEFHIDTVPYFMLGFPNEKEEYRRRLFDEIKKLKPTYIYFNILCPLPRTEYYDSLLRDGIYKDDFWMDFIKHPKRDFEIPLPRDKKLQDELEALIDSFHRRFLLSPRFVLRELKRSIFTPPMLFLKIRIAFLFIFKTKFAKPKQ